jgi:FXSXX-COOH protein
MEKQPYGGPESPEAHGIEAPGLKAHDLAAHDAAAHDPEAHDPEALGTEPHGREPGAAASCGADVPGARSHGAEPYPAEAYRVEHGEADSYSGALEHAGIDLLGMDLESLRTVQHPVLSALVGDLRDRIEAPGGGALWGYDSDSPGEPDRRP